MPFYKIDPKAVVDVVSLSSLGLSEGDYFTVRLVGDMDPWPSNTEEFGRDAFRSNAARYDGVDSSLIEYEDTGGGIDLSRFNDISVVFRYSGTNSISFPTLDGGTADNTDEDGDYGVIIERLRTFTDEDDVVDLRTPLTSTFPEAEYIPSYSPSIYDLFHRAGNGNDTVYLPNASSSQLIPAYMFDPNARFRAEGGDDTVFGGDLNDIIEGNEGDDELHGGAGDDQIFGDDGEDRIFGDDGNDIIQAGNGSNYAEGGAGDDEIYNGDGEDTAFGGEGNDIIYGWLNNDTLHGDEGDDELYGNEGDDWLEGFIGSDTLDGGADNDFLNGGAGADLISGGDGDDSLLGGYSLDLATVIDDGDVDELTGGSGTDFYFAGVGDKISELEVDESVELLGTADVATHYYVYRSDGSVFLGAFSDSIIPTTVAEVSTDFDPRDVSIVVPSGGNALITRTSGAPSSQTFASEASISEAVEELKSQIDAFAVRANIAQVPDAIMSESANLIASQLGKQFLSDPKLIKYVPILGTLAGAQDLVQNIILDYVYDFYDGDPAARTLSYASAISSLAGPAANITFQVGSFFVVEFVKDIVDVFGAAIQAIDIITPDENEGAIVPGDAPDYIIIPSPEESASIKGSLNDLDGDFIYNFNGNDKIVVVNETFGSEALTVTFGSAILDIDADLDGEVDAKITLEGDYEGVEFQVNAVGENIEITISEPVFENTPPVAGADGGIGFETDEDAAFTTGSVLGNDMDVDGDTLTVSALDTTGTLGLVTDNGDGTFDYDPNGAFEVLGTGDSTTDSFSYTVSDGNGGTDTATVTVTINGENEPAVELIETVDINFVTQGFFGRTVADIAVTDTHGTSQSNTQKLSWFSRKINFDDADIKITSGGPGFDSVTAIQGGLGVSSRADRCSFWDSLDIDRKESLKLSLQEEAEIATRLLLDFAEQEGHVQLVFFNDGERVSKDTYSYENGMLELNDLAFDKVRISGTGRDDVRIVGIEFDRGDESDLWTGSVDHFDFV